MSGMMKSKDTPGMMQTMMDSVFRDMKPQDRIAFMQVLDALRPERLAMKRS